MDSSGFGPMQGPGKVHSFFPTPVFYTMWLSERRPDIVGVLVTGMFDLVTPRCPTAATRPG